MTPVAWLVAVVALVAGLALGSVLARRRTQRDVMARTLVPFRTRQVINSMLSGAIIVRRDRRSAYANHVAAALGVARTDGALHPDIADLAEKAWRTDEAVEAEIEVRRGVLGVPREVHVRVVPLDAELAFAVANDNTEQRAAEQSRREFAVNVSHELKTPIGALSLLAESIEQGAEDPQMVRSFAKKMRKESRRLTKLIQEIIEISRLQGGSIVLDVAEVDVVGLVSEAIEATQLGAETRHIALMRDVKARATVLGDHDLLLMAVRNVIDNAVQYSDAGKRVTVSCDATDDFATIAVIDQGIGVDPKDIDHIFERFYRTDPARSRDTGGTGLGLSIVKHIVSQHSGAVDVWSQPGVGSTFTLKLPLHQEAL